MRGGGLLNPKQETAMKIEEEVWLRLSEKERQIAGLLGITVAVVKASRKPRAKAKPPEPYVLKSFMKCKLCSTITTRFYLMSPEGDHLQSREISKKEVESSGLLIREQVNTVNRCPNCKKFLMGLKKEVLVEALLKRNF